MVVHRHPPDPATGHRLCVSRERLAARPQLLPSSCKPLPFPPVSAETYRAGGWRTSGTRSARWMESGRRALAEQSKTCIYLPCLCVCVCVLRVCMSRPFSLFFLLYPSLSLASSPVCVCVGMLTIIIELPSSCPSPSLFLAVIFSHNAIRITERLFLLLLLHPVASLSRTQKTNETKEDDTTHHLHPKQKR